MNTPPQKKKNTPTPPRPIPSHARSKPKQQPFRTVATARDAPALFRALRDYRKNPLTKLWNCKTLAAELGCQRRAIESDIRTMRESLGYPLQFFPEKHGWMYTEPFTPVLAPSITKSELARIFMVFRSIEALKDSPVFAPVLVDIEKLISILTDTSAPISPPLPPVSPSKPRASIRRSTLLFSTR